MMHCILNHTPPPDCADLPESSKLRMPPGSLTLAAVAARTDTLTIACTRCDRAGRYRPAMLIERPICIAVGLLLVTTDRPCLHACGRARHGPPKRQRRVGRMAETFSDDGRPEGQHGGTVDNDWHALSEAVHQSRRNPSIVVTMMMMVMPTPAGFNDAAGKQPTRDQQREHSSQFRSHGASPALIPIPAIVFPPPMLFPPMMADPFPVSPYLPAMLLAPRSAAIPINALDPRLLHNGCSSTGSSCQSAKDRETKYNIAHVRTSAKQDGRKSRQMLGSEVSELSIVARENYRGLALRGSLYRNCSTPPSIFGATGEFVRGNVG